MKKSRIEQNPEWTKSRLNKIPNGRNTERTKSRMEKISNGTKSRLEKIPNWIGFCKHSYQILPLTKKKQCWK